MVERAFERMPQKGAMMLLQRVIDLSETSILVQARDHRSTDYPLRIDGQLAGGSLVELGAQAAAAHASMHGIGGQHAGLLLALHNVAIKLADADLAVGSFKCEAQCLYFDDGFARYSFSVSDDVEVRVSGEATLKMQAINK